jgi:hypothetical protein
MIRTGIPVSTWEREGDAVIWTAFDLLSEDDRPAGVDLDDPSTIPSEWL